MAEIYRPLLEYKDIIVSNGISIDNRKPPKKTIKRFIRLINKLDDPRKQSKVLYPIKEIVLIVFLAVLGGASTWEDMNTFGNSYKKYLKKFLELKNGIPSHDTFRRVFAIINPNQLERITVSFLVENMDKIKRALPVPKSSKRLICIDGKEQKGSGRKYGTDSEIRNLQTLHVYDASNAICLYSKMIDAKTNEIPVAQDILKSMQLKNAIVTFDALHTQTKTIELIKLAKGDYVGALKGNHITFETEVKEFFTDAKKQSIRKKENNYYETVEKAHSQIETRKYYLTTNTKWFQDKENWSGLKSFICLEKTIYNTINKTEKTEIRYYISSLSDVQLCAESIRGHWSVENSLHWHLDANLLEDDNTTTDKYAFNNLSIINKMILTIYKMVQPLLNNSSIRSIRKEFHWTFIEKLSLVLNSFDEKVLIEAIAKSSKK